MRSCLIFIVVCGCTGGLPLADPEAALLGGDTTIFDDGDEAFAYPLRNMSVDHRSDFQIGDGVFNRNWVTAPATPQGNDGLGPTFNSRACAGCHANNGRGATPSTPSDSFVGLLLRLSVPGVDEHGGPRPDPNYGGQLNQYSVLAVPPEATPSVSYSESAGSYPDGEAYSLRTPSYTIASLQFGLLGEGAMISPRLAPQVVGLGLLEAVAEATILGFAADNGGRPNHVWDVAAQKTALGRFGWKANQPNLVQQSFGAFLGDIGITSALFPDKNCPAAQVACAAAPASLTQPNLEPLKATGILTHSLGLAVPARRRLAETQVGEKLFVSAGCASCHIVKMKTGMVDGWPELSEQTIRPFTDLLLHDMGTGLADGRPDFEASGSDWRTPPLWGLGLVESINGALYLMHDGRARGFAEAILWHGGEAATAKESFRAMNKSARSALIAFLGSL